MELLQQQNEKNSEVAQLTTQFERLSTHNCELDKKNEELRQQNRELKQVHQRAVSELKQETEEYRIACAECVLQLKHEKQKQADAKQGDGCIVVCRVLFNPPSPCKYIVDLVKNSEGQKSTINCY
jgi:hypothetical protein